MSAASTQPPADLHTLGQHVRVSTDAGSFHRQLQQATLLRQQETRNLHLSEASASELVAGLYVFL